MDYVKEGALLKVLGHPVRLRMVEGLLRHECNVNKIAANLKLPQSTVSQHLGLLRNAGVVYIRKEGVRTCYRVFDRRIEGLIKLLSQQ